MTAAIPRGRGRATADPAGTGFSPPETGPDGSGIAAGPGGEVMELDDRLVRAIGIPGFGLSIPHLTGLFGSLGPRHAAFWLGTIWFVALSAAIWHGNRWLLFEQRRHWDWFRHGPRKVVMLLAAIVLYTAPLTACALLAWYAWSGLGVDWTVIRTVVLINVLCVVFVTHVYETVLLIKDRGSDLLRVAQLERARAEAELAAFRAQLDPHFVFNSLNTLSHLVETDPRRAREFNERLADIYRYMLRRRDSDLVPLADELALVRDYVWLLRIRFGDAIALRVTPPDGDGAGRLPPLSLQLLVENAVKHNELGEERPLEIDIDVRAGEVVVTTSYRPRRLLRPSAGVGLRNLDERYRLLGAGSIQVRPGPDRFEVTVPLVEDR
jgi:Histidine kinase